ncbi:hypothetical protein PR003_g1225 [Phytophthora rubi]|nr:hypothetical protein PR002_g8029 [Phytophthora rubi]KAE9039123.1 hypothetical protein PR001_g7657 [Phytophthora rubi]KAE9358505.1 hypothetical protein PR003_g1225 [Phytophthora rubi]
MQYTMEVRRLLYTSEFVLLRNYVEVIIPLVFSIYLAIMYQLPNRKYYAQLADIDEGQLLQTLHNVLLYCVLQFTSLLAVMLMLHTELGLSPIRQLAFVLEKQFAGAQIKLVFWVFYNVQASLQHYGFDYSFQFAWLHQDDPA